jgi:hypothetical protein
MNQNCSYAARQNQESAVKMPVVKSLPKSLT